MTAGGETTHDALAVRDYARAVADDLVRVGGSVVVGVYLHGSAVLGDWSAVASDVDLLVVIADAVPRVVHEALVGVLLDDRECPGVGLEASVVEARAAAAAEAPWPFVVHVNAGGNARRTVWGSGSAGDDDLVLHYAVSRASGWAAFGPSAPKRIGAIATGVVQHQLAKELRWALTHASETYAILNACRALRFRAERVLCSKTDGGNWALDHGIEPDFVRRAMHDRRAGVAARIAPDVAAWVAAVADEVDA